MDDPKLIASSQDQLRSLVRKFSTDIKMDFSLDKCAVASVVKGKLVRMCNMEIGQGQTIRSREPGQHYKYLQVKELNDPRLKVQIRKEDSVKLRKILKLVLT